VAEQLGEKDDPSKVGTGAVKYDGGKPSVWRGVICYFPRALWGVAEISSFGAKKYAWNGWADVEDGYARYQDGKCRHMLKEAMGETLDPESHYEHLKHEAWGSLAALELYIRNQEKESEQSFHGDPDVEPKYFATGVVYPTEVIDDE
jgi:hypothetical protein